MCAERKLILANTRHTFGEGFMRGVNKWMIDYITVDEKQRSVILVAKEGCLTGHIIM